MSHPGASGAPSLQPPPEEGGGGEVHGDAGHGGRRLHLAELAPAPALA